MRGASGGFFPRLSPVFSRLASPSGSWIRAKYKIVAEQTANFKRDDGLKITESLLAGIAALFGVSNILFTLQDIDYFSLSTELNVFTHTWSLGVEEQFYLLFPLLLWSLARANAQDVRGMRRFTGVLSLATVASYLVFMFTTHAFPVFNYFQLPARFWELAAGSLTCLAWRRMPDLRIKFAPLAAAVVLAGAFFLPPEQRILGTSLAVLATMTVLATGAADPVLRPAMTHPGMRLLGRISYPLYLWHWCVLALSRFTVGVSVVTIPWQLALMLALAWVTYRFIENPVRQGFADVSNRRILAVALCAALVSAAALQTLKQRRSIGPLQSAASEAIPLEYLPLAVTGREYKRNCILDGAKRERRDDTIDQCTAPPLRPDGNTIWTFGDSHAGQLQAMLYAVRDATGMGVHLIETPGTPFPSIVDTPAAREGQKTFDMVSPRYRRGDIVLLSRIFLERAGAQRPLPDVAAWSEKAAAMARELEPRGVRVVVFGPLPMFRFESVQSCMRGFLASVCGASRAGLAAAIDAVVEDIQAAEQGRTKILLFRPFEHLCPETETLCHPFLGGRMVFRDKDHLNIVGAVGLAGAFMERLEITHRTIYPER